MNKNTIGSLNTCFDKTFPDKIKDKLFKDSILNAEPFIRNLFYIIGMSGLQSADAWKQVALGSDFDGIMNPIDICPTAAGIPNFYRFVCIHLTFYAKYLGKTDLLFNKQPEELIDKLFFQNAEIFIKKYF